jgi:hypothetical protein
MVSLVAYFDNINYFGRLVGCLLVWSVGWFYYICVFIQTERERVVCCFVCVGEEEEEVVKS